MNGFSDPNLVSLLETNTIALKLLGFWKSSSPNSFFSTIWYNMYRILMVISHILFIITGFWYLYDQRRNLTVEDINSVVYMYSPGMINVMMMVIIYFNTDMIRFIQTKMQSTKFQPKTLAQVEDVKKWKSTARMFQKVFFINNAITVGMVVLVRMTHGEKLLIAAHVSSSVNWKVFFIYQAMICATGSQMCATYVTLVTSLLIHIVIQLCLLERSLQDMEEKADLKICIEWHMDILMLFKQVQTFCGTGISAVFICGVFNICTCLSLVIEVDRAILLHLLPFLLAMVAIIYSHCWCGSEVTCQSEKISYAIFSSKWIDGDAAYRKLIHIYILLTSNSLEIRLGGGTFNASLPVFVMIMKAAYSVLTLLQRFEDE